MGTQNAKSQPWHSRRSVGVNKCKTLRRRCPSTVHCAALRRLLATLSCVLSAVCAGSAGSASFCNASVPGHTRKAPRTRPVGIVLIVAITEKTDSA